MASQTSQSQSGKPLEEKKSKWRLFGKTTNKSSERLVEPHQNNHKRSDTSATSNDSHRSSAGTDDSGSLVRGSVYNTQPEAHISKPAEQYSLTADRVGNPGPRINGTMHKASPVEVHPGIMATQSGIAIEKVFQPQSVLSSSSTPSVRQETYTDPITGEVTTKTITTVVTETTTTQVTKPATSPRLDDLDVEEERRLAAEFLAASASRQSQAVHHGLQPPPRTRGSLKQGKTPIAISVHDTLVNDAPRAIRTDSDREPVGRQSSDYERLSWDRHSSELEKHLPQLRPDYIDPAQSGGYIPQNNLYRQQAKANETAQRVKKPKLHNHEGSKSVQLTQTSQQSPETRIHSQSSYGNNSQQLPEARIQSQSNYGNNSHQSSETRIDNQSNYGNKITQPVTIERKASIAGVPRSMPHPHGLTPPLEEQEPNEVVSTGNRRESWSSFGKNRPNDQESFGVKVNHHPEHTLNGNRDGGKIGDQTRLKSNDIAKKSLMGNYENEQIGLGGGRR